MDGADALRMLLEPRKIWSPEGSTFTLRMQVNPDAATEAAILDDPSFTMYELTGPDDETHVFLFDRAHRLIADPTYNGPRAWPILAGIALGVRPTGF
jgi:hypothetical protein